MYLCGVFLCVVGVFVCMDLCGVCDVRVFVYCACVFCFECVFLCVWGVCVCGLWVGVVVCLCIWFCVECGV